MSTLKARMQSYEDSTNNNIIPRIPIAFIVNGRSFAKLTSTLNKPFDNKFSECMLSTMRRLCEVIDGVFFAYQYHDKILLLARNDQSNDTQPWYDNSIQQMTSCVSSEATLSFYKKINMDSLQVIGDPVFLCKVFPVPNMQEAFNLVIQKQYECLYQSVNLACYYELLNKYDKYVINKMLDGLNFDEKTSLLAQECNIDFSQYESIFRLGAACIRSPSIINGESKFKWKVYTDLPFFNKDKTLFQTIIQNKS
jgi:tRNA(His) 5'-end guanylyltransferase